MALNIKKILFPFFKSHHIFLMRLWWFRLLLVGYVALLAYFFWCFWFFGFDVSYYSWQCAYNAQPLLRTDPNGYQERLAFCQYYGKFSWFAGLPIAAVATLLVHYAIQFIFLKLVIDFIALGGKKTP